MLYQTHLTNRHQGKFFPLAAVLAAVCTASVTLAAGDPPVSSKQVSGESQVSAGPPAGAAKQASRAESYFLPSTSNHPLTIGELVADLRAPQYAVREDATLMLMRLGPERLSDLTNILDTETNDEARSRLIRVAVHLRLKGETLLDGKVAMLGMVFNPELIHVGKGNDVRMSIAASFLQPGFPAAEVLEPGDRLIAIDGSAFPLDMSTETFRGIIQSRPVGTLMRFTVIRGGKQIEVGVRTAGIPDDALGHLEEYVNQRLEVAVEFASQLRHARAGDVVVMGGTAGQGESHADN